MKSQELNEIFNMIEEMVLRVRDEERNRAAKIIMNWPTKEILVKNKIEAEELKQEIAECIWGEDD